MKLSKDIKDAVDAIRAASVGVRLHHYGWVLDAAIDHFRAGVKRCEEAVLRHEHFVGEEYVEAGANLQEPDTRTTVIEHSRATLQQYRAILRLLFALKRLHGTASAEQFARDWFASLHRTR